MTILNARFQNWGKMKYTRVQSVNFDIHVAFNRRCGAGMIWRRLEYVAGQLGMDGLQVEQLREAHSSGAVFDGQTRGRGEAATDDSDMDKVWRWLRKDKAGRARNVSHLHFSFICRRAISQ